MARRKTKDQGTRKISKIGNYSLGITLPRSLMDGLKWKERQKVTAKKIRGGIVIRDWKSPKKK